MSAEWQVHITGPDDLLPATSRLDAMRQAHAQNAEILAFMQHVDDDSTYPAAWAVPSRVARRPCDGRNACTKDGAS